MINEAIKKLWSVAKSERELAKQQILYIGLEAGPSLISHLLDMINHPYPRFPTGREEEGIEAVKTYCTVLANEGYSNNCQNARIKVNALAINARLIDDVIYLLGELKAEESIPILIEILKSEASWGQSNTYTNELKALQSIGIPTIPHLIKEIKEADAGVLIIKKVFTNYIIECKFSGQMKEEYFEREKNLADLNKEDSKEDINYRRQIIQMKSLWVLEKIGLPQILPPVKELLKTTEDKFLKAHLEHIIHILQNKKEPLLDGIQLKIVTD
jgi:HEAT repeat protein